MPLFIKNILIEEYGFNKFSSKYIHGFQNFLTRYLWKKIDISTIDDGFINNTSNFLDKISHKARKIHTGYIYHYSLTIITALILFLLFIRYKY